MSSTTRRACGLGLAVVLCAAGTAAAAQGTYVVKHFKEPSSRGLPVKPPLDDFVAGSDARVLVPKKWRAKGTTQFETPSNGNCSYRVKFTVRTKIAAPGDAAARVEASVPGS